VIYLVLNLKTIDESSIDIIRIERLTVKDTYLGDIFVPKGSMVYIPIWTVHLDPDFHSNPQVFDPQRFILENKDNIKPYTFLPFALGPRNCIGMRFAQFEIKHALVKILIKFKFEASEETIKVRLNVFFNLSQIKNCYHFKIFEKFNFYSLLHLFYLGRIELLLWSTSCITQESCPTHQGKIR